MSGRNSIKDHLKAPKMRTYYPISTPTEHCIRLVFTTNRFLTIRTKENNWEPGYHGTVVYEIDLNSYSLEDGEGEQELRNDIKELYSVFGHPKEIDVDYPEFLKLSTAVEDLESWVQAVWYAHEIVTKQGKDKYRSFLRTLGVNCG